MITKHNTTPINIKSIAEQCILNLNYQIRILKQLLSDNLSNTLKISFGNQIQKIQDITLRMQLIKNNPEHVCSTQDLENYISEMYNQLVNKQTSIEKMKKSFRRRLEHLQILLFQKDYQQALEKINCYKLNKDLECDDITADVTLKSVNDSINQGFYKSENKEEESQICTNLDRIRRIIEDDQISITFKQEILFSQLIQQNDDEQDLHHLTLEQVLETKRNLSKQEKYHELKFEFNEFYKEINENKKQANPFQDRVLIQNLRHITDDSPILYKKSEERKSQNKYPENMIKLNKIQTGKKKAIINISDLSGLNLLSEMHSCETGRKLLTKRQRSLTSKKGESKDDKKSKIQDKETQKKKVRKTLLKTNK